MDCIFCAIVTGDLPARKIYQDEYCLAFLDIHPWHRGHSLVIPKRHVSDLLADGEVLKELSSGIQATAKLITDQLSADGLNILGNIGAVAGQEVFHAHVHLIPRYADAPGIAALQTAGANDDLDEVYKAIIK